MNRDGEWSTEMMALDKGRREKAKVRGIEAQSGSGSMRSGQYRIRLEG